MAGNRGTGKTAIVFDLIRNASSNSFFIYLDDFSSLSETPNIQDFYKLFGEFLINSLMNKAMENRKRISKLSKDDKLFLSQLIVNYMTPSTRQNLAAKIDKIQLSLLKRAINFLSKPIRLTLNYGLSAGVKLINSTFASQFSLPIIETDSVLSILPEIKFSGLLFLISLISHQ